MLKLLRLFVVLAVARLSSASGGSDGERATARAVCAPLSVQCGAAVTSGATGYAFVDINAASGRIAHRLLAFNLLGTITAAHIHETETGSVALPLSLPA